MLRDINNQTNSFVFWITCLCLWASTSQFSVIFSGMFAALMIFCAILKVVFMVYDIIMKIRNFFKPQKPASTTRPQYNATGINAIAYSLYGE